MIRTISTLLLFLAITAGCDKSSQVDQALAGELIGKWVYTEYYISPGTAVDWKPAEPAGQIIEFKKNGSFKSSSTFSTSFKNYEIIDSNTVRFRPASTPNGYVQMIIRFDAKEGVLELGQRYPMCIEGCAYRFQRVK